jgi:hypothetical protein
MRYGTRREGPAVGARHVPQDKRFPPGVEDRPFSPLLDAADLEGKAGALIDQAQQLNIQTVDAAAH